MSARLKQSEKIEMMDKSRSIIILSLTDKNLREVVNEKTTPLMWAKLESLSMAKCLYYML